MSKDKDSLILVGLVLLLLAMGGIIGSILHYWPLPINKSVFIENK